MSDRLGELLVERTSLTPEALEDAKAKAATSGRPLVQVIVAEGLLTEREILQAVAARLQLPFVDLTAGMADPAAFDSVPAELMEQHQALPLRKERTPAGELLIVALGDPNRRQAVADAFSDASGLQVRIVVTEPRVLRDEISAAVETAAAAAVVAEEDPEVARRRRLGAKKVPFQVDEALAEMVELGCSDLHLTAGVPPMVRRHGELQAMERYGVLDEDGVASVVASMLSDEQLASFEAAKELDTSYTVAGLSRFRLNAFRQRGKVGAVLRVIPIDIMTLAELGLPEAVGQFAKLHRGIVLVTGATGSGKSTTLAAIIDEINRSRCDHILTIEDPLEFLHPHKRSVVNQREVGDDTDSFAEALRRALRQDPDVILVGELRDLETISTALTAAETGHLVFGTLHTQSAAQTIDRIIDVFPTDQQEQIRIQLAGTLQGVVSQQLLKRLDGTGRVVASELMVGTPAIRNLIREAKTHQIPSQMQASSEHGMSTMDQSLAALVRAGVVNYDHALERAVNREELNRLLGR